MTEVAIGEFEIVADPAPPPVPSATSNDAASSLRASLSLLELAATLRELEERALRVWAD